MTKFFLHFLSMYWLVWELTSFFVGFTLRFRQRAPHKLEVQFDLIMCSFDIIYFQYFNVSLPKITIRIWFEHMIAQTCKNSNLSSPFFKLNHKTYSSSQPFCVNNLSWTKFYDLNTVNISTTIQIVTIREIKKRWEIVLTFNN